MSVLIYDINFRGSELLVWYGIEYAKELGLDDNKDEERISEKIDLKTDENESEESSEEEGLETNGLLVKEQSDVENLIGNFLISYNWYEYLYKNRVAIVPWFLP